MRQAMIVLWLLVPIGVGAYHYGPGQEKMKIDEAGKLLNRARTLVIEEEWPKAIEAFDESLKLLPADRKDDIRQIRIEKAKAMMQSNQLAEARAELATLVDELAADKASKPDQLEEARGALANAQYYVTWVLKLEGEPREVWEPEIDSARQSFRFLAEDAESRGDAKKAQSARKNLEAAIRLARMEVSELQGLSLPSQCKNCKGSKCKKCMGKKPGNKKEGEKKEDIRKAGSGPPPDNSGS